MNKSNLSWVDNKVLNNPGTVQSRPYQDTSGSPSQTGLSPATYQNPTASTPSPMGVSPAQFQSPMANNPSQMGVSPAQYQEPAAKAPSPTGVSPAQFQSPMANNPSPMGVSPAQFQSPMANNPSPMGVSPAQFQEPAAKNPSPMGLSPATYQEPAAKTPGQMGLSPATYQDPATTMPYSGLASAGMGPSTQSLTRNDAYAPSPQLFQQGPPTLTNPGYVPAYLRTQIGKTVRAEFAVSSSLYTDRTGVLREVGVNYLILEDLISHTMVMCDLYSLKFLTSL